jgi:mRNA interferase MazF
MPSIERGEVWLVDLGLAAKARPAAVINIPFLDHERAVYAIVPHTTALRGSRFEVAVPVPWLAPGAFDVTATARELEKSCRRETAAGRPAGRNGENLQQGTALVGLLRAPIRRV